MFLVIAIRAIGRFFYIAPNYANKRRCCKIKYFFAHKM